MTQDQTSQWNNFSCMSVALITAAAIKNIPLTADEYRARYEKIFPDPQHQYGGLILSRFYFIARDMGLGSDMDLYHDYNRVKERFSKEGITTFVFSAVNLRQGHSDIINHTSVLLSMDDQSFTVDGFPTLIAADWISKRCCAILMF